MARAKKTPPHHIPRLYRGTQRPETAGRMAVESWTPCQECAIVWSMLPGDPFTSEPAAAFLPTSTLHAADLAPTTRVLRLDDPGSNELWTTLGEVMRSLRFGEPGGMTETDVRKLLTYLNNRVLGKTRAPAEFLYRVVDEDGDPVEEEFSFSGSAFSRFRDEEIDYDCTPDVGDRLLVETYALADSPTVQRVATSLGFGALYYWDTFIGVTAAAEHAGIDVDDVDSIEIREDLNGDYVPAHETVRPLAPLTLLWSKPVAEVHAHAGQVPRALAKSKTSTSPGFVYVRFLPPTPEHLEKYGESFLRGDFLQHTPLYRVIDGEELRFILKTGKITGGAFSDGAERDHGAQWSLSLDDVVSWGKSWEERLGSDLFVVEISGKDKSFGLMGSQDLLKESKTPGPTYVPADFCNTGLGCSVRATIHDVVRWYVVCDKGAKAVTRAQIETAARLLEIKPRRWTVYTQVLVDRPPERLRLALAYLVAYGTAREGRTRDELETYVDRHLNHTHDMGSETLLKAVRKAIDLSGKQWYVSPDVASAGASVGVDGQRSFSLLLRAHVVTAMDTSYSVRGVDLDLMGMEVYMPALKRWLAVWHGCVRIPAVRTPARSATTRAPWLKVPWVYHVTPADAVQDITAHGFMPGWGDIGLGVYFFGSQTAAEKYAAAGGWDKSLQGKATAILAVQDPRIRLIDSDELDPSWSKKKYADMWFLAPDVEDDEDSKIVPAAIEVLQQLPARGVPAKSQRTTGIPGPTRASSGSYTAELHHGTHATFDRFNPGLAGKRDTRDSGFLGRGTYFSTDERVAAEYPVRLRARVELHNPLRLAAPTGSAGWDKHTVACDALNLPRTASGSEITAAARSRGHDGVIYDYSPLGYLHQEVVVFDASNTQILARGADAAKARRTGPSKSRRSDSATPEPFFHVTTYDRVGSIMAEGLLPGAGRGTWGGAYAGHVQGKVFFSQGEDAALAWFGKIEDMAEYNASERDETPDARVPVVLRIDPGQQEIHVDPAGDRDVPGSFYVTEAIPPDSIRYWNPETQTWSADWDEAPEASAGVKSRTIYDSEGDEVDEDSTDLDDVTYAFEVYGPYTHGGFKPDHYAPAWTEAVNWSNQDEYGYDTVRATPAGFSLDPVEATRGTILDMDLDDPGLFHVTTHLSALLAEGFKSRQQLRREGRAPVGLGGGPKDMAADRVSLGISHSGALRVLEGMRMMARAARGEITAQAAVPIMLRLTDAAKDSALTGIYAWAEADEDDTDPAEGFLKDLQDLLDKAKRARTGHELYTALANYEERLSLALSGNEDSDEVCLAPVGFTQDAGTFARIDPSEIGLVRVAIRENIRYASEVIPTECEVRVRPEDAVVVGVWPK